MRGWLAVALMTISCAASAGEVVVYAASSLTGVIGRLAAEYQQDHPGVTLRPVFGGSSALARQIANGARADVFIAADREWADFLTDKHLLPAATRATLMGNTLVFITPADRPLAVRLRPDWSLAAHLDGKVCTGDPASVPVGKYARQALTAYGWWDSLSGRIVGTQDVRAALTLVERGECALGIVYRTEARDRDGVTIVADIPPDRYDAVLYAGGLTREASPEAGAFWAFLQGARAKAAYHAAGFLPVTHD